MKTAAFITVLFLVGTLQAQNLFPVMLDNCKVDRFCLDCGDVKAGYDEAGFAAMIDELNKSLDLRGVNGSIMFQVLVNSKGRGCVLSHSDKSNSSITKALIKKLNAFKQWTPAITKEKNEELTSVTLQFTIKDDKLSGGIERVDLAAFKKSFDRPVDPEITNMSYTYTNLHLSEYNFFTWNSSNSELPNNMNDDIAIDQNGLIWLSIDDGLVTFDGQVFRRMEQSIPGTGKVFILRSLAVDNENTAWIYVKGNTYNYRDGGWIQHDSIQTGLTGVFSIVNIPATGELFFCSEKGLTVYKNGEWNHINMASTKELPSDRVCFAKKDSKGRIWIGTYSGSVMIDENGAVTGFNRTDHILDGKCITSMDEDENGNLYFSLYNISKKDNNDEFSDEGIAVRNADGSWKQFTTENSGLPFNHVNCVLYDRSEKVLWITTERAGLVRYDLNDGWENYHNLNSDIPTSFISSMTFDRNGVLYLATRQGLVKVERKQN